MRPVRILQAAIAAAMFIVATCAAPIAAGAPPVAALVAPQRVTFDGESVLRVTPRTRAELELVLAHTDDVWSHEVGLFPIDVRVTAAQRAALEAAGVPAQVMIADLGSLIAAQRGAFAPRGAPPFGDYADFNGIVAHLNSLAAARPDLATVVSLGNSVQSRPIWMIHVHGPAAPSNRPAVLYHGCQHAREWVTPTMPLYLADRFINDYDSDPAIRALLDQVSFYLIPVVNPDGYVYSWTTNRMWRKNRRDNGNGTFGVDLNRNWGYQWGGEGSSASTSSETYRGPAPFSEPETQAMRNYMQAHPEIVAHIDYHSYSQLILTPWAYTNVLPPDAALFQEVGAAMQSLINGVFGTRYAYGPTYDTIYPAAGAASDWTYGDQGVNGVSFELRDVGQFGFLLPADQILPTCQENYPAAVYLANRSSAPVVIDFTGGDPFQFTPLQCNTLSVNIRPGLGAVNAATAAIHYRFTSNGPFTTAALTPAGGNAYEFVLPPRGCGSWIELYISAQSMTGGEARYPLGAPDRFLRVPVANLVTPLNDTFETDLGWTVQNTNPVSGAWVRVNPLRAAGNFQPEDDHTPGAGTMCYVTGQGSASGAQQNEADVDNGPTRLLSPLLDLTGMAARLSYFRWYRCNAHDDFLVVELSNNNGGSWTQLESVRQPGDPEPGWIGRTYPALGAQLPLTAQMRLRLTAQDPGNNSTTDASFDDCLFEVARCPFALGDANNDTAINVSDIPDFVNVMLGLNTSSDARQRCDMNGDTIADADDIAAFIDLMI